MIVYYDKKKKDNRVTGSSSILDFIDKWNPPL